MPRASNAGEGGVHSASGSRIHTFARSVCVHTCVSDQTRIRTMYGFRLRLLRGPGAKAGSPREEAAYTVDCAIWLARLTAISESKDS